MKDEVEKLLQKVYNDSLNDKVGLEPSDVLNFEEATEALFTLFQKAQVEAVRAARIDELKLTLSDKHAGFRSPEDGEIYFYKIDADYLKDRLVNLKEDGETE